MDNTLPKVNITLILLRLIDLQARITCILNQRFSVSYIQKALNEK